MREEKVGLPEGSHQEAVKMNFLASMAQTEAKSIGKPESRPVKNFEARKRQLTKEHAPSVKPTAEDIHPIMIEVDIDNDHPLTDCMQSNPVKVNLGFPNSYDSNWMPAPHEPAKMTGTLLAHQQTIAKVLASLPGKEYPPKENEKDLNKYYGRGPENPVDSSFDYQTLFSR